MSYKSPDLQWGDLQYQLLSIIKQLGDTHGVMTQPLERSHSNRELNSIVEQRRKPDSNSIELVPTSINPLQRGDGERFTALHDVGLSESPLGIRFDPLRLDREAEIGVRSSDVSGHH